MEIRHCIKPVIPIMIVCASLLFLQSVPRTNRQTVIVNLIIRIPYACIMMRGDLYAA